MAWQLIIDGPLDGASNMAIDAALLDDVESSELPRSIIRFYGWSSPTISLGRNQNIEKAVDVDYCRANSIAIVYRPTGGRAVLHDDELTYAVISNDTDCFGDTIYGNYKRVSEALRLGHYRLGAAALVEHDTRLVSPLIADVDAPSFVAPTRYE